MSAVAINVWNLKLEGRSTNCQMTIEIRGVLLNSTPGSPGFFYTNITPDFQATYRT
jgi:hypothetical protein